MTYFLALVISILAVPLVSVSSLFVPLTITAVPSDSFRRGNTVTLKANFDKNIVPPAGGVCQNPTFAIRIYDPKSVPKRGPRLSADSLRPAMYPVTPYLQQTGADYNPLSGPDEQTVEKTFAPFVMPARRTRMMSQLYLGLFRTCEFATPKIIDSSGQSIIYSDSLQGTFMGSVLFQVYCTEGGTCFFRPQKRRPPR